MPGETRTPSTANAVPLSWDTPPACGVHPMTSPSGGGFPLDDCWRGEDNTEQEGKRRPHSVPAQPKPPPFWGVAASADGRGPRMPHTEFDFADADGAAQERGIAFPGIISIRTHSKADIRSLWGPDIRLVLSLQVFTNAVTPSSASAGAGAPSGGGRPAQ